MLNEVKKIIILAFPERILLDFESAAIMLLDQHFQVQQLRVAIFI